MLSGGNRGYMKSLNSIPLKIFFMVLVVGIIGVTGIIIMKYNIDRLSESYREISSEHIVNRAYMSQISNLLYEHQAVISNYVIASNDEQRSKYKKSDEQLRAALNENIAQFGARMTGDRREQLYHKLYSNYYSYLRNANIALGLVDDDSRATAIHYTNNVLTEFVEKINKNLSELDGLTVEEMNDATERMENYINVAENSEIICIICIVVSFIICIIYCVSLTLGLERYKAELEDEVEEKTRVLQKHNEKIINIQNNTIIGMANLIENRDGDTGEHVMRTSFYVKELARAAQRNGYMAHILTDNYIDLLVKAAPMHDIGKISVTDNILQKPGSLTEEEFNEIKKHASEGGRIVREVLGKIEEKEYVDIAAEVASAHHEKWDGSGYPLGLAGDSIPLSARIMAVADVFDALVSKRCYKPSMTPDNAFEIIKSSAGTHFDPVLAQLFLELKDDICSFIAD